MAEPLRRPPDHEPEPPDQNLNLYRHSEGVEQSSFRTWWFWIIVLVVAIWISAWGWHSDWWRGRTAPAPVKQSVAKPAPVVPQTPTMGVPALLKSNMADLAGKEIKLQDVLVQSTNDNVSVFVGPNKDQQFLLVLEKGAVPETLKGKPQTIQRSMILTATGTVEKAPKSLRTMRHDWKLSTAEAKQVEKTGYYLKTTNARPQIF